MGFGAKFGNHQLDNGAIMEEVIQYKYLGQIQNRKLSSFNEKNMNFYLNLFFLRKFTFIS